ncbi:multicopper oxidase, putative [Fulvimarina pelagi HTCC2506]|uniref:Multicopper oxidase, putative n=2 Tax=Fulvimarina pelagi TaxID=217511 RepID=Q0G020_9HYPH|nr:multicopper oxidase family protein [Fulvimarina pelagi]EAU40421.1 multicopper oxidase, putative [Fulvimarina pelagi HTCC2506]BAT31451.1 multicopper oxidase domain protein [Fulvimarina pelagi]
MFDRRHFLKAGAALPLLAMLPHSARADPKTEEGIVLRAQQGSQQMMATDLAGPTPIWGFGGSAPGPVLRVKAGERLRAVVENALDQPTSVHWHGIRIDNAMDGVPGLTQEAIEPGSRFVYDFVAPDPGTYWYHSHDRSWEQNARGLYGALIVEEAEPWEGADRDLVLLVDDWRLAEDGSIDDSFGQMMDWSHGGRLGNFVTVNGRSKPRIEVRPNERIRVRLINVANARVMELGLAGMRAFRLALDGMPVPLVEEKEPILLAPAQRTDLLVDIPDDETPKSLVLHTNGGPLEIAEFAVAGEPVRTSFPAAVGLPHSGPSLPDDLSNAIRAELLMEGGAMGTMKGAMHQGRAMDIRELVSMGRVWAFNGVAGDMDEPIGRFERGRAVVLSIKNVTSWPHAMHLHGHHFRVLSRNGKPTDEVAMRDTALTVPDETIEIAFVADNPGRWMLHCHMLEHSAGGMMTWFEVA